MGKKKNGFTLVELLVTIALMLTILGIAIVSFVSISNRKKEEAWNEVKAQVETAAEEYFTANEYLFEGLGESATGTISVGQLVSDDYINKVTDPRSGESLGNCAVVNVKKEGNKITAEFYEDSIEASGAACDTDNSIKISTPGAPEIKVTASCNDQGNNGWCKNTETMELTITKENGPITDKKYCSGNGIYCDATTPLGSYIVTDSEDSSQRVTKISVSNQNGTAYVINTYKIDSVAPSVGYTLIGSIYKHNYPVNGKDTPIYTPGNSNKARITANDALSKVVYVGMGDYEQAFSPTTSVTHDFDIEEDEYLQNIIAIDEAGNVGNTPTGFVLASYPSCNEEMFDASGDIGNDDVTYRSNINVNFNLEDGEIYSTNLYGNGYLWKDYIFYNGSNLVLEADASHQFKGTLYNKYGLGTYCESGIYTKDTIAPGCPDLSYGFYKGTWGTGTWDGQCVDPAGNIYNGNNGGNNYYIPEWTNLTCKYVKDVIPNASGTKVVMYAAPKEGTAEMDWYTNNGPVTDVTSLSNFDYWSTWPHNGNWPKTITASDKNVIATDDKGSTTAARIGVLVVRDSVGNQRFCYTPVFNIKTDISSASPSTPTKKTTKKKTTTKSYCEKFKNADKDSIGTYLSCTTSIGSKGINKEISDISGKNDTQNLVKFVFKSKNSKIKISDDVAAVWSSDTKNKGVNETSWHDGWNTDVTAKKVTKRTWCVTKYSCNGELKEFYVTACTAVKCGDYTKRVCCKVHVNNKSKGTPSWSYFE